MSFKEQFPSLEGKYRYKLGGTGQRLKSITINPDNLIKYCLDKQKVREVISKSCKVMHFQGCSVIPLGEKRTKAHDILEVLWNELRLDKE